MSGFNKLANLHNVFFKQSEGIDPRVAALKAQRDAIRASAGVTGPGGGTTSGRVFSDGNGGYRVEGAQYTPQSGYNQQGYKTPAPIPGAGGQANTPPVPRGIQPVPAAQAPQATKPGVPPAQPKPPVGNTYAPSRFPPR